MKEISARYYNREVELKFLKQELNGRGRSALKRWEKRKYYVVKALAQFQETKTISYIHREKIELIFDGVLGQSMNKFFQFFDVENEFSVGHLARTKKHLFDFLKFCKKEKISRPNDLSAYLVVRYLKVEKIGDHSATYSIKQYFKYLYETGVLTTNYSSRFPKFKRNTQKLPSLYNNDEIEKLISSIDRSTVAGKRDYIIALLAARRGMRISDIANLKLTDINWNKDKITFNQKKTGVHNELPFDAEIGNAIIEYVQFARPISKDPHVFIRIKPPHLAFKSGGSLTTHVKGIFIKSEIPNNGRSRGPHSLRHSFAQSLMDAEVSMDKIMALLGHVNLESTKDYARANLNLLKKCILSVNPVNEDFYKQKGGKFYV